MLTQRRKPERSFMLAMPHHEIDFNNN